jgi:hypothetical protein
MLDVKWEELVGVRPGVWFRDEGVGELEKGEQGSLDRMSDSLKERLAEQSVLSSAIWNPSPRF